MAPDNIAPKKVEFKLDDNTIVLQLQRVNGLWQCDIISGYTGTGFMTGGPYETIDEFEKECIKSHTYNYHFFNCKDKQDRGNVKDTTPEGL